MLPLLLLAIVWLGRNYGRAFALRVRVNLALGAYNAVAELLAPQLVYADEDPAGSVGDELYAAVVPALSYYDRILWYESLEQENYEWLALQENARAAADATSGSGTDSSGVDGSDTEDSGGDSSGVEADSGTNGSGLENSEASESNETGSGENGSGASGSAGNGNGVEDSDVEGSVATAADSTGQLSDEERDEIASLAGASSDGTTGTSSDGTSGTSSDGASGTSSDEDSSNSTDGNSKNSNSTNSDSAVTVLANLAKQVTMDRDKLEDFDYLKSTFYQVDGTTSITSDLLDASELLAKDMSLEESDDENPQILIYHTHSQEGYADSVDGDSSTTVVGVGEYLTELLTEQYGYKVLHHTGEYDVGDRDHAYTNAAPAVEKLLEEYPSIQVVIDLHRDGVSEGTHLVTEINGKQTAQIMFFNGISHTTTLGDISWLPNPYIEENLAFSLQLQLAAAEYYPGFTRKIYIKGYRYNMHYVPQSLLIEVGAQTNTLEEAMNAMEPLAAILDYVLSGASSAN